MLLAEPAVMLTAKQPGPVPFLYMPPSLNIDQVRSKLISTRRRVLEQVQKSSILANIS